MFKILKSKQNSDATIYYMDIIRKSIIRAGYEAEDTFDYNDIKGNDVVTLNPPQLLRMIRKGAKRVFVWFQGVDGVEYLHYGKCNWLKRIERYIVLSLYEFMALKKSSLNFFVSHKMLDYYRKTFGYRKDNYIIMPCFNDQMHEDAFYDAKYKKPSFVYAGNLAKWQCFPQMIDLYKKIKERIADAELTIFTSDQEEAKQVLKTKGVEATVKYVPYLQLAEEIKEFKYGFLIREDDIVNNVATPTKMCNYLSNGIIPIYSNVIGDFQEELKDLTYAVALGTGSDGIDRLLELEQKVVRSSDVKADFQTIFNRYYSEEYYIKLISQKISQYCL